MRKTRKSVLAMLAVLVISGWVLSFSACGKKEGNAETKSLYTQGLEVVQLMSEMVQSEEYIGMYTDNSDIKSVIQNISTGDYTAPKAVYAISIADENLAIIGEIRNLSHISTELKTFLTHRIFGSVMVQLNSMSGVESLAAASICTIGKTFVNKDVKEDVIYLYTYDNAIPIAVTFIVGEDQTVSADGVFIMYDAFTCESVEEVKSLFRILYGDYGNLDNTSMESLFNDMVEVTEVLPE